MKMTEDEALREYIRRLDDLMSFVGREELPYSLTDLAHGPSANDGPGSQGERSLGLEYRYARCQGKKSRLRC